MENESSGDILDGAKDFAEFLRESGMKVTMRRVFHLLETQQIPAGKLGCRWIGSRRAIRAHFARIVGAAD